MLVGELWLFPLGVIGMIAVWSGDALLTLAVLLALLVSSSLLVWRRYCLAGVTYRRQLSTSRAAFGDTIELAVEIINLKPLPLTWLRIEDIVPRGLQINGAPVRQSRSDLTHALTLLVAILPYERVVRRMQVRCIHRGELTFGPASLESGDYLGTLGQRRTQAEIHHLVVYPKIFPLHLGRVPSNRIIGRYATRRSLLVDPVRTIGAREYVPGDPYRRIDWRSSARFNTLMVKVCEPSTTPILQIIVNFQKASRSQNTWEEDALEFGISIAASLAAYGAERGWAVGLRANGRSGDMPIEVRPSAAPGQIPIMLETLARASTTATGSSASLLMPPGVNTPAGATLVLITTILDNTLRSTLRDLHRRGWALLVLDIAPDFMTTSAETFPILRVPYDEHWAERDALVLGQ